MEEGEPVEEGDTPLQVVTGFMSSIDGPSRAQERARLRAREAGDAFAFGLRRNASSDEQIAAARGLSSWVNDAYGLDASALGQYLRDTHKIALVLSLLYVGVADLHRHGLMILANLVSDAFDVNSLATKRIIVQAGIFERLKDFLYAGDAIAQVCACACMQNLCTELTFAQQVRAYELTDELEHFVEHSRNPQLRRYAAGALSNTLEVLTSAFNNRDGTRDLRAEEEPASGARGLSTLLLSDANVDEFELSDATLDEIHMREAEHLAWYTRREEAAIIIQGIVKRRKASRTLRFLIRMIRAVRLVAKCIVNWRHRRRRRAALRIQAHARAYICASLGLCSYGTTLAIVYGLRAWSARAIGRMVRKRIYEIEGGTISLARPPASDGAHLSSRIVPREPGGTNLAPPRFGQVRRGLRRKVLLAGRSLGRDALEALQSTLPRPPTISARVPLFATVVPGGTPKVLPRARGGPQQHLPLAMGMAELSLSHSPSGGASSSLRDTHESEQPPDWIISIGPLPEPTGAADAAASEELVTEQIA